MNAETTVRKIDGVRQHALDQFSAVLDDMISKKLETNVDHPHGHSMCPSCGYNLSKDFIIVSGDLTWCPDGSIYYKGERLHLSISLHTMLGAIMRGGGSVITKEMIINRVGTNAESKIVDVWVHNLRKFLKPIDMDQCIDTVWGRGYRWISK